MVLRFEDLTYALGSAAQRRVTVSGSLNGGEVLAVRGPSGVGKTTLLRVLARLQPALGGEVYLKGKSWRQVPGPAWRAAVHYLPQKPVLFDGTAGDNLAVPFRTRLLSRKKFDGELAAQIMEKLLLPPGLWSQDARTLSGGEAARLAFTRALLTEPHVLLLDEPTAALDERAKSAFFQVLSAWLANRSDRAVLIVSHDHDYAGLGRVSYLDLAARREDE